MSLRFKESSVTRKICAVVHSTCIAVEVALSDLKIACSFTVSAENALVNVWLLIGLYVLAPVFKGRPRKKAKKTANLNLGKSKKMMISEDFRNGVNAENSETNPEKVEEIIALNSNLNASILYRLSCL